MGQQAKRRQLRRLAERATVGVQAGKLAEAVAKAGMKLNAAEPRFPLRRDLPDLPERIKPLPVDARGYPVPWFVAWVDGKPEFRIAEAGKRVQAVRESRCWVCGQSMAAERSCFVIGPMCAVNRVSSDPGSHRECAEFSCKACPFLAKPHMTRREGGLLVDTEEVGHPGQMIARNPGVMAVWESRKWTLFDDGEGGFLFNVGDPVKIDWWAEGRAATRAEVEAGFESGLPILYKAADEDPGDPLAARRELTEMVELARMLFPED